MPKVYGTPIIGGLDPMGPSPLTLLRDNTDVLIDNTIVETALFTYPVPAYTLDGDRGLRVTIKGSHRNNSGSDKTFTIRVKYGATTLWAAGLLTSTAALSGPVNLMFELIAKNSDAVQEMDGHLIFGSRAAPTTGEGGPPSGINSSLIHGDSTEDATTALDLVVTVEMSGASADAWFIHRKSIVELL